MTETETDHRPGLKKASIAVLIPAALFFPMIFNPILFGVYDPATSEAESVVFIEDNWLAIRLLFAGIAISMLLLGLGLSLWAARIRPVVQGRWSTLADVTRWAAVVGGTMGLVAYASILTTTPAKFFDYVEGTTALVLFLLGWIPFSVALIGLGAFILTSRLEVPRLLGAALGLFAILPYTTGLLPLWFYVGAMALGVAGLWRSRSPARGRHVPSAA